VSAEVLAIDLSGARVERGGRTLLAVPKLEVQPGERAVIVGANGAGKSTLLRLIAGTEPPTAGSVAVLGWALHEPSNAAGAGRRAWAARVGMLHQGLHLVPRLDARTNVLIGALARPGVPAWRTWCRWFPPDWIDEAEAALAAVGLAGRGAERVDRLSGGERQKVALARLTLQRPELILADEPTSALDPAATAHTVQHLLKLAAGGATLLTIVHDLALVPVLGERVIGLRDGRVVLDRSMDGAALTEVAGLYGA
jgi:phosphonate transport system ATP-binding protein